MRYTGIEYPDVANGLGVGVVLWCQGCRMGCPECHNPETWDINGGQPFTTESMNELFAALDKPYIKRLTISGGHPLEPENTDGVLDVIKQVKARYPQKAIWLYTGWTIEELYQKHMEYVLQDVDILVDGRYVAQLRNVALPYRGSENQRVIDVKKSREANKIILFDKENNNG